VTAPTRTASRGPAADTDPAPASPHSRPLVGGLFVAAGATWTAAEIVLPDYGTTAAARYQHIAAAPGREGTAGALLAVTAVLFVLAALAAIRRLPAGRGRRFAAVGVSLLGISGVWFAGGLAAFDVTAVQFTDGKVPASAGQFLIGTDYGLPFLPLDLTLLCLLVGPVVLSIGLIRARRVSALPLVLWVAGLALYIAFEWRHRSAELIAVVTVTAALTLLGRALDRIGPDL
jgi:hypothetical protein